MLQPALLNARAVGNACIERIVASDVPARRGAYAVTGIRVPRIGRRLRSVLLHGKAFQRAAVWPEVREIVDHRNRKQRLGAGIGTRGCDVSIGGPRRSAAAIRVSLEIPIRARRVCVELPVVAARGISAPAV